MLSRIRFDSGSFRQIIGQDINKAEKEMCQVYGGRYSTTDTEKSNIDGFYPRLCALRFNSQFGKYTIAYTFGSKQYHNSTFCCVILWECNTSFFFHQGIMGPQGDHGTPVSNMTKPRLFFTSCCCEWFSSRYVYVSGNRSSVSKSNSKLWRRHEKQIHSEEESRPSGQTFFNHSTLIDLFRLFMSNIMGLKFFKGKLRKAK